MISCPGEEGEEEFDVCEAYPLMDEVARSEGWYDPEMDIYDQFDRSRSSEQP